jgi:16S rRNA (uracil1498-N3)-methyltransferase
MASGGRTSPGVPMRRFFVPEGTLGGPDLTLHGDLAHRLARVLRLKRGDCVVLSEGDGVEYEVRLTDVSPRAIEAEIIAQRDAPAEPGVKIVLYQSLIRANRFDLVLEKGTEIGVARFVPLIPSRGQIQDGEASGSRMDRWHRVVVEAAEQSNRGRSPEIDPPAHFEEAVSSASGLRLLPWEGEGGEPLGAYLRSLSERPASVSLFIGPEGGFDAAEVDVARDEAVTLVTLGPRILRSETAAIAVVALAQALWGDLG